MKHRETGRVKEKQFMLSFFGSRTRQVQEMNLTQRREGARTQRVFANKSLRLASLRLCVFFGRLNRRLLLAQNNGTTCHVARRSRDIG